jgi:hypothetical protein
VKEGMVGTSGVRGRGGCKTCTTCEMCEGHRLCEERKRVGDGEQ